jgi:hypothetical protein
VRILSSDCLVDLAIRLGIVFWEKVPYCPKNLEVSQQLRELLGTLAELLLSKWPVRHGVQAEELALSSDREAVAVLDQSEESTLQPA